MPPKTTTTRRNRAERAPCLQVKINGKQAALLGLEGEGGVSATVSRWWNAPGGDMRLPVRRDSKYQVRLEVTDASEPTWHRMYVWPTASVREGDRVEVRVVQGTPERGRFHGKYHPDTGEEVPFEKNDTYAVVGSVAAWVDGARVCIKEKSLSRKPIEFTPFSARRFAKMLLEAAKIAERRTRK